MDLQFAIEPHDILCVRLTDGADRATVSVAPPKAGVESLMRAFEAAVAEGYGECFWPGSSGGQYWWIFKCDAQTIEVVAMWSRGGVTGWQHVFRATAGVAWVRERLTAEAEKLAIT